MAGYKSRFTRQDLTKTSGVSQIAEGWFFGAAGGGGGTVSGSVAWTEANDTASLSGSVIASGTVAWTEANDTCAIAGSFIGVVSGSVSWTEANDTASLSGSVIAAGTVAWTEADDVTSISGTFGNGVFASLGWTEDNDTAAIAGSVVNPVTAAINWTEANDTASLSGGVTASGVIAWTEDNDVTAITGSSFASASGEIGWAEQDDVTTIYATVPSVGGAAPDYSIKKKHVVRVGDRLMVFSRKEDALAAIQSDAPKKQYPAKKGRASPSEASLDAVAKIEPEETISLPEVKAMARVYDHAAQYEALIQQHKYDALLALHQILIEREEEDIELLLLAM